MLTDPAGRSRRGVLFVVTSFWAYGELAIALELATRLAGTGWRPLFLVPPSHRAPVAAAGFGVQVLVPGSGKINRIQLRDIELVHRPALVVLADFLNYSFCDRHYGLHREDLDVFSGVLGTFDNFAWGRPGAWMDTYGFPARHQREITLDGLEFRLRPCPLNKPDLRPDEGVLPYPLLAEGAGVASAGPESRASLGLPADGPLVLLTSATWQHLHAAYPRVTAFVEACTAALERLVETLARHATVVSVGPRMLFAEGAPDGFHAVEQLPPDRFRRLAGTADLHVSTNVGSVALHRLALGGTPSVVLSSSAAGPGAYPFRMFPVGWYHFLESLVVDNPFSDTVRHAELFDVDGTADILLSVLSDDAERAALDAARVRYLAELDRLPDVGGALELLAAGARV